MITIYTSRNYGDRAERCGVSDQRIEPGEPCIYVKTGRHGNDAKPRALFELVVDALRRGGWEEIIAPALGAVVQVIELPNDSIVLVGRTIIYTEDCLDRDFSNKDWPALRIAKALAKVVGTQAQMIELATEEALREFMADHGIPEEEWTYVAFAAAVLGVSVEEVQYGD